MPRGSGGGHRPVIAHDESAVTASDDGSHLSSLGAALSGSLPTAGVMLAIGFVVGTLLAFIQPFMSRASRTRGQPVVA